MPAQVDAGPTAEQCEKSFDAEVAVPLGFHCMGLLIGLGNDQTRRVDDLHSRGVASSLGSSLAQLSDQLRASGPLGSGDEDRFAMAGRELHTARR